MIINIGCFHGKMGCFSSRISIGLPYDIVGMVLEYCNLNDLLLEEISKPQINKDMVFWLLFYHKRVNFVKIPLEILIPSIVYDKKTDRQWSVERIFNLSDILDVRQYLPFDKLIDNAFKNWESEDIITLITSARKYRDIDMTNIIIRNMKVNNTNLIISLFSMPGPFYFDKILQAAIDIKAFDTIIHLVNGNYTTDVDNDKAKAFLNECFKESKYNSNTGSSSRESSHSYSRSKFTNSKSSGIIYIYKYIRPTTIEKRTIKIDRFL